MVIAAERRFVILDRHVRTRGRWFKVPQRKTVDSKVFWLG